MAISNASDAPELNMEEAITQGMGALDRMKLKPSLVEPIQGIVDTTTTVVDNVKSLSDTWDPLLQKIEIFSKLVDSIAEV